jgi:hypothetical protein
MTDPFPPTPADTDTEPDDHDPEAPELIDLEHPEPPPGTDIVPPDESDDEEDR